MSSDSSDDGIVHHLIATGILLGDNQETPLQRRGTTKGRVTIARNFDKGMKRLMNDYFEHNARYGESALERRFRMPKTVFNRLFTTLNGKNIFARRVNAAGKAGIHPLQRVVVAIRMLCYGSAADSLDEYLHMSEDSILLSLKAFCSEVVKRFSQEYLREPTEEDLQRILRINAARGFPGCIGSIDCQHWEWKNCPIAWEGQFQGKEKKPTVLLEAIADGELWIWHIFFGMPGSLNDLNVLDHSTTMAKIRRGDFPPSFYYAINGKQCTILYYLADGIYPSWAIFMKTMHEASSEQEKSFAAAQESVRKDVERAFGVLTAQFQILQRPFRLCLRRDMTSIMETCIIMHNMVVEHRRDEYESGLSDLQEHPAAVALFSDSSNFVWSSRDTLLALFGGSLPDGMWAGMVASSESRITSRADHYSLKTDLIRHIWERRGNSQ